jgi:hypothetical protein
MEDSLNLLAGVELSLTGLKMGAGCQLIRSHAAVGMTGFS